MIVYAPSYAGLVQGLKLKRYDEIEVISNNKSIIEFCFRNNIKHTTYQLKKPESLLEIKRQKKKISNAANKIKNNEILFCFYGFDLLGLFFMYRLKKKNRVFFLNQDFIYTRLKLYDLILRKKDFIDFLIYFRELKLILSYFNINESKGFFGVSPERLSTDFIPLNIKIKRNIFNLNKSAISRNMKIPKNSVIFIDQGSSLFNIDESVIEFLDSNYSFERLYLKPHPNHELSNIKLNKYQKIPDYIPLELIINPNMVLIGVSSRVLLKSTAVKKISLINKVQWNSNGSYLFHRGLISQNKDIEIM